jgi:glycoside/pentoside/hexuronide:cation symporter, GPH family
VASTEVSKVQSKGTLVAYGGLALPLCLAEIPIILYLPAFYAQAMHLSPALVGIVFLFARMWDGLSDILVGWLSDRSMSRYGRRKPWTILGAPLLMVSTWFLCNPPQNAGLGYLCIWAALFYTSFTSVKIPHLSWGTELATDYLERSRVTAYRETFTMIGNLFFVSVPLIFLTDDAALRSVLFLISVTTLITVPPAALALGLFVRDPPSSQRTETHLGQQLFALTRDRILLRFLLARLIFATEEGVTNSLLVFSFSVGLNLPNRLFWAIFILYVATIGALPLTLRAARRVDKHRLLAAGVGLQGLAYGCVIFVPSGHFGWVAALWVLIGIANTAMLSLPTSVLSDIIDHGEVISGERHSGAYVAIDNLVYKIGMALGVGMAFGLLTLVHYDPSASQFDWADARNLRLLGFGLPCLLSVPVVLLYLSHPITKKYQHRLREIIDSRALNGTGIAINPGQIVMAASVE